MSNSLLKWSSIFRNLKRPHFAHGIFNLDDELLSLSSNSSLDAVTLGFALDSVQKFFPLKNGDFYVLNDPSCGGLGFRDLTFVGQVGSFHIVFRAKTEEPWNTENKQDYFRIPPTPILQAWSEQKDVLLALAQALPEHSKTIQNQIPWMQSLKAKIQLIERYNPELADRLAQKRFLQESQKYILEKMKENFQGDFQVELKSKTGELLKLKQKLTDQGLLFDLSGTGPTSYLALHETWVRSIVSDFVFDLLDEKDLINESSLTSLRVQQPVQAFTNHSGGGKNTFAAQQLGTSLILTALHQGFQKSYRSTPWSTHNYFPLQALLIENNTQTEFKLPSASGQSLLKVSFDGLNIDDRKDWLPISDLQKMGLQILAIQPLSEDDKSTKGKGWQLKAKALKKLQLRFLGSAQTQGSPSVELKKQKNDHAFGQLQLNENDEISFYSGSGI